MSVYPYLAVHVDTVEFYGIETVTGVSGNIETLAVPAGAGREIAHTAGSRRVLEILAFYAPVMREIQAAPGPVVERRLAGGRDVSEPKLPSGIEILDAAPRLRRRNERQAEQQ